jgi:hypothetical protein
LAHGRGPPYFKPAITPNSANGTIIGIPESVFPHLVRLAIADIPSPHLQNLSDTRAKQQDRCLCVTLEGDEPKTNKIVMVFQ